MSRLYMTAKSDSRRTPLTSRGHQNIEVEIRWGSRSNSKILCILDVNWQREADKPTVHMTLENNMTYRVAQI